MGHIKISVRLNLVSTNPPKPTASEFFYVFLVSFRNNAYLCRRMNKSE